MYHPYVTIQEKERKSREEHERELERKRKMEETKVRKLNSLFSWYR